MSDITAEIMRVRAENRQLKDRLIAGLHTLVQENGLVIFEAINQMNDKGEKE